MNLSNKYIGGFKMKPMLDFKVKFKNGKLTCLPKKIEANHKEKIKVSGNAPFVIMFPYYSPIKNVKNNDVAGIKLYSFEQEPGMHVLSAKVIHNPDVLGRVKAKFSIAAGDGNASDIIDPEIIIPRREGGHRDS